MKFLSDEKRLTKENFFRELSTDKLKYSKPSRYAPLNCVTVEDTDFWIASKTYFWVLLWGGGRGNYQNAEYIPLLNSAVFSIVYIVRILSICVSGNRGSKKNLNISVYNIFFFWQIVLGFMVPNHLRNTVWPRSLGPKYIVTSTSNGSNFLHTQ